jgi:hypothetical protein
MTRDLLYITATHIESDSLLVRPSQPQKPLFPYFFRHFPYFCQKFIILMESIVSIPKPGSEE